MAKVIPVVGEPYEVQPKNGKFFELEELQKIVEGYIEIVRLDNGKLMVVNEEGKLAGLPFNEIATAIYQKYRGFDCIVGNVIISNKHEIR